MMVLSALGSSSGGDLDRQRLVSLSETEFRLRFKKSE